MSLDIGKSKRSEIAILNFSRRRKPGSCSMQPHRFRRDFAMIPLHRVKARNISVNAENRIHDEEGARGLGFAHGLVSGVTVYSYLFAPLLRRFGPEALESAVVRTAFFAPVYDGEDLLIGPDGPVTEKLAEPVRMRARRASGEPVATLELSRPPVMPEPASLPGYAPREAKDERPAFSWERVIPGRAFHGFAWAPGIEEHQRWCASVGADDPVFRESPLPPLHPGLILQQANQSLTREFRMNPWIHVSSRIVVRDALRAGDAVEVRAMPVECWEKKGDRYARIQAALVRNGRAAVEIDHKTILEVSPRVQPAAGA